MNGYVKMVLNKLELELDSVTTDDDWQEQKFDQPVDALRNWTVRNPSKTEKKHNQEKPIPPKPSKLKTYQANQQEPKRRPCVYCAGPAHQSINCDKVTTIQERMQKAVKLKTTVLYCTGANHRASECRCTSTDLQVL